MPADLNSKITRIVIGNEKECVRRHRRLFAFGVIIEIKSSFYDIWKLALCIQHLIKKFLRKRIKKNIFWRSINDDIHSLLANSYTCSWFVLFILVFLEVSFRCGSNKKIIEASKFAIWIQCRHDTSFCHYLLLPVMRFVIEVVKLHRVYRFWSLDIDFYCL